ncbi:MAG: phosphoenolpyruvate carboxykinase (GTP) [Victivallales bacterium]|nr:phosphoenolpyruvate carboxykinase (GTP) [Victivallales bacterium]MCF7889487.1 phosphoenolpyruvate carboxykinase (GTP) [Victivallales bacterium]
MNSEYLALLEEKMGKTFHKLEALKSEKLVDFLGEYIKLCNPDSVYMCDDSEEDAGYIRDRAINEGEEIELAGKNRTIHYDGYGDQARDKKNTKFMVPENKLERMGSLNCVEYKEGLAEIKTIAENIMKGKEAIVKIFCEGPIHSVFSRPCVQLTDSAYVAHSEDILYRRGYEHFLHMEDKSDFWSFCHSAGELDENMNSVNLHNRRIYQDLENNIVYSMNAQYAGNTVGLKKHSMRLAINESGKHGWLCEHMFLMSVMNDEKNRKSHFCGAFPSACGKTSTAMIPGEKIIGDDICYFRNINGQFKAVNVENGIFGIIKDVNEKDDPVIYKALQENNELIFSNVLTGPDNNPYWTGMGIETPKKGRNHSGEWFEGKKDSDGKEIPISHPNSRYTMRLEYLDNIDQAYNDRDGVDVDAIVYGGRDSDTTVPVEESRDWKEGIIIKAVTLESETTAATLGKAGVRVPCLMANLDFISYPIGEYIHNNVKFTDGMDSVPKIFSVNYFMKDKNGKIATSKLAKKVWIHWAEGRCNGEYDAFETPTGYIPVYEDVKVLFKELLDEDFTEELYEYLFSFRCNAWLAKLERAKENFKKNYNDIPQYVYDMWDEYTEKIKAAKEKYGDIIAPGVYKNSR